MQLQNSLTHLHSGKNKLVVFDNACINSNILLAEISNFHILECFTQIYADNLA